MPGAVGLMATALGALDPEPLVTTMFAELPVKPEGSWALICSGPTKNSGAGRPLKVTEVPPSEVESGTVLAVASPEAKLVPKIETIDPGATGWRKPAASTTPLSFTFGV